jgi:hypothetical protein
MLPPDRSYKLQTYAFGRPVGDVIPFTVGRSQVDLGDVSVARPARLVVTVNQSPGVPGDFADVVLVPAGGPGSGGGAGTLYGLFGACEPMLGPQHGASPACNRAVTFGDGRADLLVPPGRYFVYAHRGPFAAIARQEVTLAAGDDVALTLTAPDLPGLVPAGVLSGDFHVHGGASYDTIIPDRDRVASFLAHAVDVVIATDHDVVADYAETLAALGSVATGRLVVVAGVEATPNLLWFMVPGESFPKTLGHFNFWPLRHDPLEPRGGAPWDELLEPGGLMDAVEPLFATGGAAGVRQMNHPWSDAKLGRDQGFLRVLGYDPRIPIRPGASYAADILLRAPGGGHRNIDWDVQEVMTGADRGQWLSYREIWFSLLSQGIRKAGAANSDTHSLHADQVGCPRNLVFTGQALAGFDLDRFDADVRAGRMVGTTGPVLDAYVADASGGGVPVRPSLGDVTPGPGAELVVEVRAAPFIPVEEVRVFVNGQQVRTASVRSELGGLDPFGERIGSAVVRMPLADLVAGFGGDVWLVVEAGMPQPAYAVDPETGLPELSEPVVPASPESPLYHIEVVAPGVLPLAFTNPFFLDLDGGGWTAPGLPQESGR